MSYGSSTTALQNALVDVLSYRRISAHMGATNGRYAATTTPGERLAAVHTILRYREPVITWAARVARFAPTPEPGTPAARAPGRRLRAALEALHEHPGRLPEGRAATTLELGTRHELAVVEAWRRAACAAVEGLERDLPDLHDALDLTRAERTDLARDVVAVTEALLILDDRYGANTPGWTRVCSATPRAAVTFACMKVHALRPERDPIRGWSIDDRGHTPPAVPDGPEPSPVRAAAAFARTLSVDPPSAGALRRCVHHLSRAAGRLAEHATAIGEEMIAEAMAARARSYGHLQGALRNVGALHASTTAAKHAIDLDQTLATTLPRGDDLHALARTWARVDAALGQTLLNAIGDGSYLGTWTTRIEANPSGAIRRARPYFEHLTAANHPHLLTAAARLARTPTTPVPAPPRAVRRALLDQSIQTASGGRVTGTAGSGAGTGSYLQTLRTFQHATTLGTVRPVNGPTHG